MTVNKSNLFSHLLQNQTRVSEQARQSFEASFEKILVAVADYHLEISTVLKNSQNNTSKVRALCYFVGYFAVMLMMATFRHTHGSVCVIDSCQTYFAICAKTCCTCQCPLSPWTPTRCKHVNHTEGAAPSPHIQERSVEKSFSSELRIGYSKVLICLNIYAPTQWHIGMISNSQ